MLCEGVLWGNPSMNLVNEIRYKEVQQIVTISNYSTLNGLSDFENEVNMTKK